MLDRVRRGAADLGGAVLAAGLAPWGPVRGAKPLHPAGVVYDARLDVTDPAPELGATAFTERASLSCLVRVSRATGIPEPLPDVAGLALRLHPGAVPGSRGDLLFASTGTGRLSRFLLVFRSPGRPGSLTTLLPLRSAAGPVLFAATATGSSYDLSWAPPRGDWNSLARLDLLHPVDPEPDPPIRFDPVGDPPEGLEQYDAVLRLRAPAYRWARRLWPGRG